MKKIVSVSLVSVLLASCSFIPDFSRPDVPVPERWKAEMASQQQGVVIPAAWWTLYQDETLNSLMNEALTQNLDLRAGFERVNQARADLRMAGASLLPSASASLGASKTRTNPASGSSSTVNSLSGELGISYDLDLFGANRSDIEAARATLHSTQYQQESLKLVTLGEIANAYFNLISARERVRIAEDNLSNAKEILNIAQKRVEAGLDTDLELSQQKVAVATSEASISSIRHLENTYQNALAVLLGRAPQDFSLTTPKTISGFTAPQIALEQPSSLLERRPDIHSAEQALIAADANIGAARAAFFPSISLGGTASIASTAFGNPATSILALASSLTVPIFTGGALEGGLDKANAQQRELVETYRKTVLVSFREVEDALSATKAASESEASLRNAVDASRRAYEISRKRYEVGTIDFQTLLTAQSSMLSMEDSYTQALLSKLTASVDLVKAMGGGWNSEANVSPVQPETPAPAPKSEEAPATAPVAETAAPVEPATTEATPANAPATPETPVQEQISEQPVIVPAYPSEAAAIEAAEKSTPR